MGYELGLLLGLISVTLGLIVLSVTLWLEYEKQKIKRKIGRK